MAQATIYHNPRCTKSRQALQAVEELGVDVDIVRYLDTPPDEATLRSILAQLEDPPADLVRREKWSELGVTDDDVATVDGVVGRPAGPPGADAAPGRRQGRTGGDRAADRAGDRPGSELITAGCEDGAEASGQGADEFGEGAS